MYDEAVLPGVPFPPEIADSLGGTPVGMDATLTAYHMAIRVRRGATMSRTIRRRYAHFSASNATALGGLVHPFDAERDGVRDEQTL